MNILPAGSASRHWLCAGLALGLAATCQAGMVVQKDAPDEPGTAGNFTVGCKTGPLFMSAEMPAKWQQMSIKPC